MCRILSSPLLAVLIMLSLASVACVPAGNSNSVTSPITSVSPAPSPASGVAIQATTVPITLPVLDAFFASDDTFEKELSARLGLTEEQISRLRAAAREETSKLRETDAEDHTGTAAAAQELAAERIGEIVGAEKAKALFAFVRERWQGSDIENAKRKTPESSSSTQAESLPSTPNSVPTDSRVVVNSPAYRMDLFENGRLIKSYKIGIGYPEFPLPTGLRKARAIIFNPTWTPPDEPWVESPASKVKVGEKVEAGSNLNPLGLLKIPIGSPSLIHGGKSAAKLGTFASHGCVGLTDALVEDFAKLLARIGGVRLSSSDIAAYKKNRSETRQVTLVQPVRIELRYETIVAEDGKLHIYRDVYDRNTNTEESLRTVLQVYGVQLEQLTADELGQVMEALTEMSRDAKGRVDQRSSSPTGVGSPSPSQISARKKSGRVTRTFKGKKEIVIEIAALEGKGYPPPANANTGKQVEKSARLLRKS